MCSSLKRVLQFTRYHSQATAISTRYGHHPYFLPRNSRGSLPVYTDIRNAGATHLVLIRNAEGNVNSLANDISETLFQKHSPEASRMKVQVIRSKHLVITGGRWKNNVVEWLTRKGF